MAPVVGYEKPANFHHNKKAGKDRSGQRVRKLQLSDVEWYVSARTYRTKLCRGCRESGNRIDVPFRLSIEDKAVIFSYPKNSLGFGL